jgi:AhpD family alkylhydroperoxidase
MRHETVHGPKSSGAFVKRIYNCPDFKRDFKYAMRNFPRFMKIVLFNREIRRLVKKILLIVSAVNNCVYCKWFHTKMALITGIAPDEVRRLLMSQIDGAIDNNELPALLYARHYAETHARPDPEMTKAAAAFYGEQLMGDLTIVIKNVTFANLGGNTFDAIMSAPTGIAINALRGGNKTDGLSIWCILLVLVLGAPILLPIKLFASTEPVD